MTPEESRFASAASRALVAAFAVLLAAPAFAYVLGFARNNPASIYTIERRQPATPLPSREFLVHTPAYTRQLESVIADAFPFRIPLISGYDALKFYALGESANPSVTRGRDGWLFWDLQNYARRSSAMDSDDLSGIVAFFRARSVWCAAHGAHYVLLIAPEKSLAYPEELPSGSRLSLPTVVERLVPMLRKAGVDTVDPLPAILAAKRGGEVYSRGDTHWNGRGAYAAYGALVADLHLPDAVPGALPSEVDVTRPGDLLNLSGISGLGEDHQIDIALARPRARDVNSPKVKSARVTRIDDPRLPSAVFFSDSFGLGLAPLLAENFRRAVLIVKPAQHPFDAQLVSAERPRFVIQELIERQLTSGIATSDPNGACFTPQDGNASPRAAPPRKVQAVSAGTLATIDWVNYRPLGSNVRTAVAPDQLTTIGGWAVDAPHRTLPRAVFVRVDDRPAVRADTCLGRPDVAGALGVKVYRRSGFTVRLALSPGSHRIRVDVLSGDGSTLYRDIRPLTIDV
jgi:hypothetical protein